MSNLELISSEHMKKITVKIREPFAEFLAASKDEYLFELSLLDVVRFAGHACPSMVGAFMISREVIKLLFPETNTCIRGDIAIELPTGPQEGASGPISNVFSFIFGAWEKSGFGGLEGEKFIRRDLLKYNSPDVPRGAFRFQRLSNQKCIDIFYDPRKAHVVIDSSLPFQQQWRTLISRIVNHPEEVLRSC